MAYNFEKLDCWNASKSLALETYKLTNKYPPYERFALTSQSTRAAVSIAANIAEGSSRASKKDFIRFLEIALGSAFELETLLIIAQEQEYFGKSEKDNISNSLNGIIKQIYGLKRRLQNE